jgi:hypothetical protein
MIVQKSLGLLRYLAIVTIAGMSIILLVELGAWVLHPSRYDNPPDVTADAWIYSDGLAPGDTIWMKEFVDEFCRSYRARWSSYVYYRREPFSGKHITVDSAGIRATFPQGKPSADGRRPARVFVFGGSTMWGTGARDAGTIPSALARLIVHDPDAGPATVVNMGESGYVSTQALLRLELELRKGNVPDIVILYDGVNDVFSAFQNGEPGLPQNEVHRATEFNLLREGGRLRALGVKDLLGRTVTASVLQSIRSTVAGTPSMAPPDTAPAGGIVSLYRGNLSILEGLGRQYGFRYEAYWQPVVFSRKNPSPYELAQSEKQKQVRPFFAEAYRRVERDSLLRGNAHFHNLGGVFDTAETPVYIDFCHVTETGNAIIAEAIYADIRPFLRRLPPR